MREQHPGTDRELAQQRELRLGEVHQPAALGDPAPSEVDLYVSDRHDRGLGRARRRGPAPAERRVDPGQELLDAEGLGHVVVGAQVERADLVGLGPAGRQHDDADVGQLADVAAQLEPVGVGQHQVEQHEVRDAELECPLDGLTVLRDDHVVAANGQVRPDEVHDVLVVFHDQNDCLIRQPGIPPVPDDFRGCTTTSGGRGAPARYPGTRGKCRLGTPSAMCPRWPGWRGRATPDRSRRQTCRAMTRPD